jgi:hypothetical protein
MNSNISFTHILNPFPAKEGSERAIASSVTWRTLRVAKELAVEHGIADGCWAYAQTLRYRGW